MGNNRNVKVRTSIIDDWDEKQKKPDKQPSDNKKLMKVPVNEDNDFEMPEFDSDDEQRIKDEYYHTIVNISDSQTIKLCDIRSIDKDFELIETPSPRWMFSIVFNKDKMNEKKVLYSTEELRDEKYSEILQKLKDVGFSVLDF